MPNTHILNGIELDGGFVVSGSGEIIDAEQTVGIIGSGLIISIEQNVEYRFTGSGLIISVEQEVVTTGAGLIISVEQNITNVPLNKFYTRNGYDVDIFINGYQVPKTQIHGELRIDKQEGKATSCRFTLIPGAGIQNPESFQGKPIYINIFKDGVAYRVFTGYVDLPTLDIIDKKITFDCTDRRTSQINSLSVGVINAIGSYSADVFGPVKDQADALSKRLETVPSSFDFDNNGNSQLTAWAPKSTADFVLAGNDIYYTKPEVSYTNRTQTLNTINFTLNYTYQRLHQQVINIGWSGFQDFCDDWFDMGQPSFPARDTISNASQAGNWRPVTNISFTDVWPAGGFSCSTPVSWNPNQVENEYKARSTTQFLVAPDGTTTWPDGNKYPIETFILDSNNNKIYDIIKTTVTDRSSQLCRGASWRAATKFSQNVSERYNITLRSPQAINKYGIITQTDSIDINDTYDISQWENLDSGVYNTNYNFFLNQKNNYSKLLAAMQVALTRSRVKLLEAHRDVTVSFSRGIWPQVDLKHTVETTATQIACKGKVTRITHVINISNNEASTDVVLKLSRAAATDANSTWAIVIPPIEDPGYIGNVQSLSLGTHTGTSPDPAVTPNADKWNGWIGNANIFDTSFGGSYRTDYPESFIVDYPKIPNTIRGDRVIEDDYTFSVTIPNDPLVVTF